MTLSRHHVIGVAGVALAAHPIGALSQMPGLAKPIVPRDGWEHSLSRFGDVRYPADFKYFDYVNPGAPKGGTVRQIALGTFDNFNPVVAGLKGNLATMITNPIQKRPSVRLLQHFRSQSIPPR
jgi:microcin C transport system substrate-binding protein